MNAAVRTPSLAAQGVGPEGPVGEAAECASPANDAPARRGGAESISAPSRRVAPALATVARARWTTLTTSVWWPIVWRFVVTAGGTLALAAIGAASLAAPKGVAAGAPEQASALDLAGTWITAVPDAGSRPARRPEAPSALAHPHGTGDAPPPSPGVTADGRIVLNVATAEELDRLPGVGRKRAEAIVALRTRLGKFRRLSDLLRIRGIGPRSLAKLKPHLVLDPPPASDAGADAPRPRAPSPG